jgi:hypothetical protein
MQGNNDILKSCTQSVTELVSVSLFVCVANKKEMKKQVKQNESTTLTKGKKSSTS